MRKLQTSRSSWSIEAGSHKAGTSLGFEVRGTELDHVFTVLPSGFHFAPSGFQVPCIGQSLSLRDLQLGASTLLIPLRRVWFCLGSQPRANHCFADVSVKKFFQGLCEPQPNIPHVKSPRQA